MRSFVTNTLSSAVGVIKSRQVGWTEHV